MASPPPPLTEDPKASKDTKSVEDTPKKSCPHPNKRKYALDMCHSCYHKFGKPKKAHNCEHTDKPHYAGGLCQKCYLAQYYVNKKRPNRLLQKTSQKQKTPKGPSESIQ